MVERNDNQAQTKEIKLLVIGATGAGKSSLINLFYVWSKGINKVEDLLTLPAVKIKTPLFDGDSSAEAIATDQGIDQKIAQTQFCKIYDFELEKDNKKYKLSFMDSPGLGDTRGLDQDERNIDEIVDAAAATEKLNAILLMMNGAEGRLTSQVNYVLLKLQGLIPNVLEKSLFALLSNTEIIPNLDLNGALDFKIPPERIFSYNNQIFNLPRTAFSNINYMARANQSYQASMATLSSLFEEISRCEVKQTTEFKILKDGRYVLQHTLVSCKEAEAQIYSAQVELNKLLSEIASGSAELADLQQRLAKMKITRWVAESTKDLNTTCMSCKSMCHETCGLDEISVEGSELFKLCLAFNGSEDCQSCGHHFKSHKHLRERYVEKEEALVPETTQKISTQLTSQQQMEGMKATIEGNLASLQVNLETLKDDVKGIVGEMSSVCSRFDYVKEVEACSVVLTEQIQLAKKQRDMKPAQNESEEESKTRINNASTKIDSLEKSQAALKSLIDGLRKHVNSSDYKPSPQFKGRWGKITDFLAEKLKGLQKGLGLSRFFT